MNVTVMDDMGGPRQESAQKGQYYCQADQARKLPGVIFNVFSNHLSFPLLLIARGSGRLNRDDRDLTGRNISGGGLFRASYNKELTLYSRGPLASWLPFLRLRGIASALFLFPFRACTR